MQQNMHMSLDAHDKKLVKALIGFILLAFTWTVFAKVDRLVRAEGRIIAAAKPQIVQHLEGGIVTEILVREGQKVNKGDVLIRLSDVDAMTSVQQGQQTLEQTKAKLNRLHAEAQGDKQVTFDDNIGEETKAVEVSIFAERQQQLRSELQIVQQQIGQRQAEWQELSQRARSIDQELSMASKQAQIIEGLHQRGAASQMELLDAQGKVQRLRTQLGDAQASIPRLRAAIAEMQARMGEVQARFRAQARDEWAKLSGERSRQQIGIHSGEDRLQRTEIRAPATGYINKLNVNTIGGVIRSGEPALEITPSEGPVAIEARVRPNDRASLMPGLQAKVFVGAYDYARFGSMDGVLVEVSADTLVDEMGQHYYRVLIETQDTLSALAQQPLVPGMSARADVVLGERSILSFLTSPLVKFSSQALREAN
jgi:adhesin transport system membrane fusion protein